MGRNKEFKVEEVVDRALGVFWTKGYEAASVNDLVDAMGIQRASLYGTFGSKADLYEETLRTYQLRGLENMGALLDQEGSPLQRIQRALETAIPAADRCSQGCFCLNATVEVASDVRFQKILREHFDKVEGLLARVVAAGQAEGEIALKRSPIEVAKFLLAVLNGLHLAAKTETEPDRLHSTIALTLHALRP